MEKSNWPLWPLAMLLAVCLSGCSGGGGGGEASSPDDTNGDTVTSPTNPGAIVLSGTTNGRLLASNCYQCHGTNGTGGFDRIYKSDELLKALREFASGAEGDGIMAAHAQGYTDAQMQAIASYLANP